MSRTPNSSGCEITWLTQGGFLVEAEGSRLVIDPYMSDSLAGKVTRLVPFPLTLEELRPNSVVCTHDHGDHLDPLTVEMIRDAYPLCVFGGPQRAHRHLGNLGISGARLLEIGKQEKFGPFVLTPTFARHSDPSSVGLLIAVNRLKIYITADTEFDERLFTPQVEGADAVMICINGRLGNMTWREAVESVLRLRPAQAFPMHYGLFAENTEDPSPFIAACREAGIASSEMPIGKPFRL